MDMIFLLVEVDDISPYIQWLFLVPLKGGIGSIFHPAGLARIISGI